MKKIPLTKEKFAIVDDEDFEYLNGFSWQCSSNGYAVRKNYPERKMVRMHRVIVNTPDGMETDHINGDRLDNRKSNLRICTREQNRANFGKSKNNISGYKGVSRDRNSWRAELRIGKKKVFSKSFNNVEDAARAYDKIALIHYGEFAKLNFPVQKG